ncbi:MAG TPA: mycofactocin biosynthesis glycosyltransferase MftF [Kineosporiaceae bacterium]
MTDNGAARHPAITADRHSRFWKGGPIAMGGAPWGVVRLGPTAAHLLRRAITTYPAPVTLHGELERQAAHRLIERGLAHPVHPRPAPPGQAPRSGADPTPAPPLDVEIVVPVYGRPELLDRCLAGLRGQRVIVVDDASPTHHVSEIAARHGARLVRHPTNRGPAAARNTGLRATTAPVVAFIDADCLAPTGWTQTLARHFHDPRVVAVAPRIRPLPGRAFLIVRYEHARSALDMGPDPALVRPGSHLGFLPSAALLVRRDALHERGFDEDLRLGEDVDLVWRLADAGGHVRYDPTVIVEHELRDRPRAWAKRRFEYGTSAADLATRHPQRLTPLRISPWNLAALAALATGRPRTAALTTGLATLALARSLRTSGVDPTLAPVVVGKGLVADAAAIGHALRREWWPLGWTLLARAPSSTAARAAALTVLTPLALEWCRARPPLDPLRYTAMRLLDDALYGSGVLTSAARAHRADPVLPRLRRRALWRPGRG